MIVCEKFQFYKNAAGKSSEYFEHHGMFSGKHLNLIQTSKHYVNNTLMVWLYVKDCSSGELQQLEI